MHCCMPLSCMMEHLCAINKWFFIYTDKVYLGSHCCYFFQMELFSVLFCGGIYMKLETSSLHFKKFMHDINCGGIFCGVETFELFIFSSILAMLHCYVLFISPLGAKMLKVFPNKYF
uniref:Uncharacterized protein n=1 Tax=Rhizophora mucronata TaxID=61149 RepID=A0A2P2PLY6_RHIMU